MKMSAVERIADLVIRQVGETAAAAATSLAAAPEDAPTCEADNEYDGRIGLRISAIFVILVGSTLGASPLDSSYKRPIANDGDRSCVPSLRCTT